MVGPGFTPHHEDTLGRRTHGAARRGARRRLWCEGLAQVKIFASAVLLHTHLIMHGMRSVPGSGVGARRPPSPGPLLGPGGPPDGGARLDPSARGHTSWPADAAQRGTARGPAQVVVWGLAQVKTFASAELECSCTHISSCTECARMRSAPRRTRGPAQVVASGSGASEDLCFSRTRILLHTHLIMHGLRSVPGSGAGARRPPSGRGGPPDGGARLDPSARGHTSWLADAAQRCGAGPGAGCGVRVWHKCRLFLQPKKFALTSFG